MRFSEWKENYKNRKIYRRSNKYVFLDIAKKYLPSDKNALILDIGAGNSGNMDYIDESNEYNNIFMLDQNSETIEKLMSQNKNAILYKAPARLPFNDASVSYVLCSHLIEHLYDKQLHKLLEEIDRVLSKDGVLVINSPMLWNGFYSDISHVRPYNPEILIKYLSKAGTSPSRKIISHNYSTLKLCYRFNKLEIYDEEGPGSDLQLVDFLMWVSGLLFSMLRIGNYVKNGYTLVVRKD